MDFVEFFFSESLFFSFSFYLIPFCNTVHWHRRCIVSAANFIIILRWITVTTKEYYTTCIYIVILAAHRLCDGVSATPPEEGVSATPPQQLRRYLVLCRLSREGGAGGVQ